MIGRVGAKVEIAAATNPACQPWQAQRKMNAMQ
jgi:hypothetical protein